MDATPLDVALILSDPDGPAAAERDMEFLLTEVHRDEQRRAIEAIVAKVIQPSGDE